MAGGVVQPETTRCGEQLTVFFLLLARPCIIYMTTAATIVRNFPLETFLPTSRVSRMNEFYIYYFTLHRRTQQKQVASDERANKMTDI